jgi:cytochrome c-type biogenesis protein CcmE
MNAGMKFALGAVLIVGSVGYLMASGIKETRVVASQPMTYKITDGSATYPVVYRGLAPDTFNDSVEVVVEGRLQRDGVIHATDVLAKCGSKYEAVPKA